MSIFESARFVQKDMTSRPSRFEYQRGFVSLHAYRTTGQIFFYIIDWLLYNPYQVSEQEYDARLALNRVCIWKGVSFLQNKITRYHKEIITRNNHLEKLVSEKSHVIVDLKI